MKGNSGERGWDRKYIAAWAHYLAMVFLVAGGLNALVMAFVEKDVFRVVFGEGALLTLVYGLIGLSALSVVANRDTYLPFLGPTVIPCGSFPNRDPPNASLSVHVKVAPHAKVLYWAAEPANEKLKDVPTWKEAYQKYENAGVATADASGAVVLRVRPPQAYRVPSRGLLEPHLHYRVCEEAGWMGRIHTVPIGGVPSVEPFSEQEAFANPM